MMIKLVNSTFIDETVTKKALCDFIMESKKLSMGSECEKFEKDFATWQGCRFALLVNSGSSANLLLVQAMLNSGRWKVGDKIGVSAVTWSTNVMPIIQLGLIPVLIDVDIYTLNINLDALEKANESINLSGLFITNCLGLSPDLPLIAKYCLDHSIEMIEDNCESMGSALDGKKTGNFSLGASFSLFVGHHLSVIEGGIICTNNEEFYHHLMISRAHGWTRNLPKSRRESLRTKHNIDSFYEQYFFVESGFNLRPTEITGFLGNKQLSHIDMIVSEREKNYYFAKSLFEKHEKLLKIRDKGMETISSFSLPFLCEDIEIKKTLLAKCAVLGIETRPMIAGSIARQPFMKRCDWRHTGLDGADFIHDNYFYIGNHEAFGEQEYEALEKLLS